MVTPNLAEARELTGLAGGVAGGTRPRGARRSVPTVAVVTGGHTDDGADRFFDGERLELIEGPRHPGGASHGSGCTHSSALAARLALGDTPLEAARAARQIAAEAVANGLRDIGSGAGPVDVLGIIDVMKLLRMTPGKGDVLLAEGDPGGGRGRGAPDRGVPPPARPGHVGGGARTRAPAGQREATMVRDFSEIPAGAERVIFFPQAAGG